MRKILFMMLMLFSVSSFAGNSCEDESTDRDVVLKEEGSKDALSTANEGQEPNGCVGTEVYECQVWYVTPNGAGMILEEGRNGDDVNEDEQEKP